jgi:hypothetical protein
MQSADPKICDRFFFNGINREKADGRTASGTDRQRIGAKSPPGILVLSVISLYLEMELM